jgi:hypothetical protein
VYLILPHHVIHFDDRLPFVCNLGGSQAHKQSTMMKSLQLILVLSPGLVQGFVVTSRHVHKVSGLHALTERQMQFWEDVEEGLDDIEQFYAKQGESIERIRQFGKR